MTLLIYFLLVHFVLLVPSFGLFRYKRLLNDKPDLQLCMAYFSSITIFAIASISLYALNIPKIIIILILWVFIIFGTFRFLKQRNWENLAPYRFLICSFLLMSLLASVFLSLSMSPAAAKYIPDPEPQSGRNYNVLNVKVLNVSHTPANDNYIPYRQAQFFINDLDPAKNSFVDEWGVHFFQRTPLMGSVVASFFLLFDENVPTQYLWDNSAVDSGHTYEKFQIISHVLNSLLVLPAFFIIRYFFNRRVALISIPFIVTSHFYLYNSVFSWPKSLVAFFILLSWLLLLEKKQKYLALGGIVSGFAYLAHDLAVLYIGVAAILLIMKRRYRSFIIFLATLLIFMAIWAVISGIVYNKPSTFIYYPFALNGIPNMADKPTVIQDFIAAGPWRIISIKLDSLLYLLTPYQLIFPESGQAYTSRFWTVGLYSVPGSLGPGLFAGLVLGIFSLSRKYFKLSKNRLLWLYIIGPIFLCVMVLGNPRAVLGSLHFAEVTVVLLTGFTISRIIKLKHGKRYVLGAFIFNVLYLLYFISFSYSFKITQWAKSPGDMISLAAIFSILIFYAYVLVRLLYPRNDKIIKYLGIGSLIQKNS